MGRRDARRTCIAEQARGRLGSLLVEEAVAGRRVVFLDASDPFTLGEEIAALRSASIPFDIVPGVTAPASLDRTLTQAA
jgi:uroporphyrin-III C-methyltransferase/precorrin-2 dehydrogenase/sirohydrochlorin ferrochelatase